MAEKSTTPDLEETLRRGSEAVNRGDFDAAVSMFAPDGVWEFPPLGLGVLEGGPLMGHDAMRKVHAYLHYAEALKAVGLEQ
jgi:hypothetical protein